MFQPETTGQNRPTSTWTPEGVPQSEKEWNDRGNGEYETYYNGEYDGEYAEEYDGEYGASIGGEYFEESEVGSRDRGNGEYHGYYDEQYDGGYDASNGGDYFEEGFWESDSEGWRLKDGRYIPF